MYSLFPNFVIDEDKNTLMEAMSKEENEETLHSFQKDKSPRLMDGMWNSSLGSRKTLRSIF
jgi:hypothetical protein